MESYFLNDSFEECFLVDGVCKPVSREGAVLLLGWDGLEMEDRKRGMEALAAVMRGKARIFGPEAYFEMAYEAECGIEFIFSVPGRGLVLFRLCEFNSLEADDCMRYVDDISREEAAAAFADSAFVADEFASLSRKEYVGILQHFRDTVNVCMADEDTELMEEEFQGFREGLKLLYRAYLRTSAKCRCVAAIPKGTDGKRIRAILDSGKRRSRVMNMRHLYVEKYAEMAENNLRGMKAMGLKGTFLPEKTDTPVRVRARVHCLKAAHSFMLEVNSALCKAGKDNARRMEELHHIGLTGERANDMLKSDEFGNVGFPPYSVAGSLGRIKAAEQVLERVSGDGKEEA